MYSRAKRPGDISYPVPKKPRISSSECKVTTQIDGYMTISRLFFDDISFFLPVLKIAELDSADTFYPDALDSCRRFVPPMPGITTEFVAQLSNFKNAKTSEMVEMFKFTCDHLLYDKYDPDNPGHLFCALQIFGGWWGGLARETFIACLRAQCRRLKLLLDVQYRITTSEAKTDELVIGVLSFICKCFGCAARTPLLPHVPFGAPPNPVSALVDYLVGMEPSLDKVRVDLFNKLRDWHVPAYARDAQGSFRAAWDPSNHVARLKALMSHQIAINEDVTLFS